MTKQWADVTNSASAVRGETLADAIKNTAEYSHEQLVAIVVNERLNEFVAHWADRGDDDEKLAPYIGWFWRSTDFVNGRIPIGDSGGYIGVMENNKWDYPQRDLTPEEAKQATDIVWSAYLESRKGGNLAEIEAATKGELARLNDLFQTFTIERRDR